MGVRIVRLPFQGQTNEQLAQLAKGTAGEILFGPRGFADCPKELVGHSLSLIEIPATTLVQLMDHMRERDWTLSLPADERHKVLAAMRDAFGALIGLEELQGSHLFVRRSVDAWREYFSMLTEALVAQI